MKKILPLIALTLVLVSCQQSIFAPDSERASIENNTLYGVYVNGLQTFILDENQHQQCISKNNYRIQTDNQSVIVNIALDNMPTTEGEEVSVNFSAIGTKAIESGQLTFKLTKSNSDAIWLWNETNRMGVIVPSAIRM